MEIEADPEEDLMDAASLNKKPLGLSATIHRIRVIVKSSSSSVHHHHHNYHKEDLAVTESE